MNERIAIQNLVDELTEQCNLSKKDADTFLKELFTLIVRALEAEKIVKIKGLGTFKLIEVDSRESVNITTGERFEIQGHTKVSFTPDATLRDQVNKPFAHFETVILNEDTVFEDTLEEVIDDEVENEALEEVMDAPKSLQEFMGSSLPIEGERSIKSTMEEIVTRELMSNVIPTPSVNKPNSKVSISVASTKSNKRYFIAIIAILLLLGGGAIFTIYNPALLTSFFMKVKNSTEQQPVELAVSVDTIVKTIPVAVEPTVQDDIVEIQKKKVVEPIQLEKKETKVVVPVYPDTTDYQIVGTITTHTVADGERLTQIAKYYLGTKNLWPYIVKHNPAVITNPDLVPIGTVIRIPELMKKQ